MNATAASNNMLHEQAAKFSNSSILIDIVLLDEYNCCIKQHVASVDIMLIKVQSVQHHKYPNTTGIILHCCLIISFEEWLERESACSSMKECGSNTPQINFVSKLSNDSWINQSSLVHCRILRENGKKKICALKQ